MVQTQVGAATLELWRFDRIPDNPAAWLTRLARNRAIDAIRKQRDARRFAPELAATLQFLAAAQGERRCRAGRLAEARRHLDRAIALSRNETERRFLESKRAALGE